MRQISALMLLGAAIGIVAPLGAAGRVEPIQAQNQAPPARRVPHHRQHLLGGRRVWLLFDYHFGGDILHDTGTNEMHDTIVSNVKKLGFEVKDIKIMISSHAHFDHVQGHPQMQKLTGAQVVALGGDAAALEAGVDNSAGGFRGMQQVHVDRVIKDGDTVTLGGTTLRALWVPGHTQGATIWTMNVQENGRTYSVAFRGGETPNAGVPLFDNPRHPKVVEDTKFTLERLKALQPPDLFLHNHQQNLGRPLNPALPVNPRCITCMDAQAFKEMVRERRKVIRRESPRRGSATETIGSEKRTVSAGGV